MSADRHDGFTLLEVLVALTIAGLALVVLFRSGGEALHAVDMATRTEQAVQRAQSHLAAVGRDVRLLQGASDGDDGGGYHWHLRITPIATWRTRAAVRSPTTATLFNVEVAISWGGHGHRRSVVLRSRRLGSAAAPAADR